MTGQSCLQVLSDSIDRSSLPEAPEDVREFARAMNPGPEPLSEKRRWRRYPLVAKVVAVPLDDEFEPIGPPFVAFSRNISFVTTTQDMVVGGLSLIYNQPVSSENLFVEVERHDGPTLRAIVKVLRNRPVSPFFEIAGRFINPGCAKDHAENLEHRNPAAESPNAASLRSSRRLRSHNTAKRLSRIPRVDIASRAVKRDVDLIRQILLLLESRPLSALGDPVSPKVDGWDRYTVERHFVLMAEAQLIETVRIPHGNVQWAHAVRLKWDGHEFLEQCRCQAVWEKSKRLAMDWSGGLSVAVLKEVLKQVATESVSRLAATSPLTLKRLLTRPAGKLSGDC